LNVVDPLVCELEHVELDLLCKNEAKSNTYIAWS